MPNAMTPIANLTLGSNTPTVTFTSITGIYRDLLLVISGANGTSNNALVYCRFNSDSGGNYNSATMSAGSDGAVSYSYTSSTFGYLTVNGGFQRSVGSIQAHFFDYSVTNKHKTYISRNASATKGAEAISGRWANTAAITSIQLKSANDWDFESGTSFALYGVSA